MNELVEKVIKVIESCETPAQLITAFKFSKLAYAKLYNNGAVNMIEVTCTFGLFITAARHKVGY